MFDTQAVKTAFGRAAAMYDAHADLQRHMRAYAVELAKPHWRPGAHILDAGCGTGLLADGVPWRITGLDLSPAMCALAAKRITVLAADMEHIPLADEGFDGVFSSLALQWANDPAKAFSEMARVLKPGRMAVISTLAEGTLAELAQAFKAVDEAPHVSDFLPVHHLLSLAHKAGFSLSQARQIPIIEYYPDSVALMRALQNIGATNARRGRKKGLMTSRQFARIEQAYRRFQTKEGLPATWQALYLVLRKN